nr:hypothetical protein [Micromonospora sp. DSM 115978]
MAQPSGPDDRRQQQPHQVPYVPAQPAGPPVPPVRPPVRPPVAPAPQAGFWRRLMGPPVPPLPSVPESVSHRRDPHEPILVPALGDAFDFQVYAAFTWTAHRMTHEDLLYRIDRASPWAVATVREWSAAVSRGYPPHRSAELEQGLNTRFNGQSWPSGSGEGAPRFSVQVRVSPDQRVRERLRPYWEERIKLECEHELNKLRTLQAEELTRRWREVLRGLEQDPETSYAARLTGERFAQVFGEYVRDRQRVVPDLVALLEAALKGHGELGMGPSEYTEAWDVALRTYQRQHGLIDAG